MQDFKRYGFRLYIIVKSDIIYAERNWAGFHALRAVDAEINKEIKEPVISALERQNILKRDQHWTSHGRAANFVPDRMRSYAFLHRAWVDLMQWRPVSITTDTTVSMMASITP